MAKRGWRGAAAVAAVLIASAGSAWIAPPVAHAAGPSWQLGTSPSNPPGSRAYGVTCAAVSDCWAAGQAISAADIASAALFHWDGSVWTQATTPATTASDLGAVSCVSTSECWALGPATPEMTGGSGQVALRWDGTSWSSVPPPYAGQDLSCTGDGFCVATPLDGGGGPIQWQGDISTHTATQQLGPGGNGSMSAVSCVSSSWCMGTGSPATSQGAWVWNGANWSAAGSTGGFAVDCTSSSNCWSVGEAGPTNVVAAIFHWDGSTWTQQSLPSLGTGVQSQLLGVSCLTSDLCFATGGQGTFDGSPGSDTGLILRWDGTAWSVDTSLSLPDELGEISCVWQVECVSVGVYNQSLGFGTNAAPPASPMETVQYLLPSTTTTLTSSANPADVNQSVTLTATVTGGSGSPTGTVQFYDGSAALGSPQTLSGGVATYTTSWPTGYPRSLKAVYSGDDLDAASQGTLGETVNAVASWQKVLMPDATGTGVYYPASSDVACARWDECWAVGGSPDLTPGPTSAVLRWNGAAWVPVVIAGIDSSHIPIGVTCLAQDDCWMVGGDEYTSADGFAMHWDGTSWVSSKLPGGSYALGSVSCPASNDCWAAGTEVIHWDGQSWTVADIGTASTPTAHTPRRLACPSTTQCVMVEGTSSVLGLALWNGQTWSQVPVSSQDITLAQDLDCVGVNDCWISGFVNGKNASQPWEIGVELHFDGTTVTRVAVPDPAENPPKTQYSWPNDYSKLGDISCVSTNDCLAVGGFNEVGGSIGGYSARWDGTSWSIAEDVPFAGPLDCRAHDYCWLVSGSTYSYLYALPLTTTTMTSDVNPSTPGNPVRLFAKVIDAGGVPLGTIQGNPVGTVTFYEGATQIGAPQPVVNGVASVMTGKLTSGDHTFHAEYNGDADNSPSAGYLVQQATGPAPLPGSRTVGHAPGPWVAPTVAPTPAPAAYAPHDYIEHPGGGATTVSEPERDAPLVDGRPLRLHSCAQAVPDLSTCT